MAVPTTFEKELHKIFDEIDNLDDHARVTEEILPYDEADAQALISDTKN